MGKSIIIIKEKMHNILAGMMKVASKETCPKGAMTCVDIRVLTGCLIITPLLGSCDMHERVNVAVMSCTCTQQNTFFLFPQSCKLTIYKALV